MDVGSEGTGVGMDWLVTFIQKGGHQPDTVMLIGSVLLVLPREQGGREVGSGPVLAMRWQDF
jgi:hypothetical protein